MLGLEEVKAASMLSGAAQGADASQGARWHEQLGLSQDLLLMRSLVSTPDLKPAGGGSVYVGGYKLIHPPSPWHWLV